jgi:hypothetical protein
MGLKQPIERLVSSDSSGWQTYCERQWSPDRLWYVLAMLRRDEPGSFDRLASRTAEPVLEASPLRDQRPQRGAGQWRIEMNSPAFAFLAARVLRRSAPPPLGGRALERAQECAAPDAACR